MADSIGTKEPPNIQWISLSEALSWIAFRYAMDLGELKAMVIGESVVDERSSEERKRELIADIVRVPAPSSCEPPGECDAEKEQVSESQNMLREALVKFADQASSGNFRVRGRHVSDYMAPTNCLLADTAYLSDLQSRDFARFDELHGGLRRGTGLDWLDNAYEHGFAGGDGWRDVEVCRAELLKAFPAEGGRSKKPFVKRKNPGPAPDPAWPDAIAKVTEDCIAAGYTTSLKRGDKAAIQTMLLTFMAEQDKHFSEDTAAKYAKKVIERLPDN